MRSQSLKRKIYASENILEYWVVALKLWRLVVLFGP